MNFTLVSLIFLSKLMRRYDLPLLQTIQRRRLLRTGLRGEEKLEVMAKAKTKGGIIEFRPPLKDKKKSFVEDEVIVFNADVHIERMNDERIFMLIKTESMEYGFDFYVGDEITNSEGQKVRQIMLIAKDYKL